MEQNPIAGLIIGDEREVKFYDYVTKTLETLAETPGTIYSMEYHDGELWIGQGVEWKGVGNLHNVDALERSDLVSQLFIYDNKLFSVSSSGLYEVSTSQTHIAPAQLAAHRIKDIDKVFSHNNILLALVTNKDTSHSIYNLKYTDDTFYIGDLFEKRNFKQEEISDMLSVQGHLVSNLPITYSGEIPTSQLEIDNKPQENTKLIGEKYHRLAYDPDKNVVYAMGWRLNTIKEFNICEQDGKLTLTIEKDLVSSLSDYVYAILPVTKEQIDKLKHT